MKKAFDYVFVGIQIILFIMYWWLPNGVKTALPNVWLYVGWFLMSIGFLIVLAAIIQLRKQLTMLPSPTDNATLITNGVFYFLRHPIYAGIIYFALGYALYSLDFNKLLIAIGLLLFFELKTIYEEKKLKEKFPEYEAYKNITGKFFPALQNKIKQDGA